MDYLDLAGIEVMEWLALSAVLNPTENLCGIPCTDVFKPPKSSTLCSASYTGTCGGMAENPLKH